MTDIKFDVVGIGNAIVDVLSNSEDSFLAKHNLIKGSMTIIDDNTAEKLYSFIDSGVEVSGGSAANTIACIASVGGSGAFVGKVCKDQLGNVFTDDIRRAGVYYETKPDADGDPTARCLIYVTPDAERTMQTFLGACTALSPDDIDERVIVSSKVIYLEGYLYDPPQAKAAFIKAAKVAKKAGRMVSFSLSDQFCVDRHRAEFLDFVNNYVDVLFANEDEINSLYQVDSFEEALENVRGACNIAAVTRGSRGSVIVSGEKTHFLVAEKVRDIIDTTGAGDSYAAGFLYGLTQGKDLEMCGRMGGILAADIIGDYGARSKNDLKVVLDASLRD